MPSEKPKSVSTIIVKINSEAMHKVKKRYIKNKSLVVGTGDIILYSLIKEIKKHLVFNSAYSKTPHHNSSINVSYYLNIDKGAKPVVIKNTEKMNFDTLSKEIKIFGLKYIHDELTEQDQKGATVTVTNLFSVPSFIAIPPLFEEQASTFGITSEYDSVEIKEGKVHPIKEFNITLSFDYRISDCQTAFKFLNGVKSLLEDEQKLYKEITAV